MIFAHMGSLKMKDKEGKGAGLLRQGTVINNY